MNNKRTPKERLYWLLQLISNSQIEMDVFCNEFHITFDHDLNHGELSEDEIILFRDLAHTAARFTESAEDLKMYPNVYFSAHDIQLKVQNICSKFIV